MISLTNKTVSEFVESIYECSTNGTSAEWAGIYEQFAQYIFSGPGGLVVHSARDDRFNIVTTTLDPDCLKKYFEHFQFVSPFRAELTKLKAGGYFSRRAFLPDEQFLKSSYYNEFSERHGAYEFEYHALCSQSGMTGSISFSLPKDRPEFSREERELITFGVRHLRRAFANYLAISELKSERRLLTSVLDSTECEVLVVDRGLKVIYANRLAENRLKEDGLIRVSPNGVLSLSSQRALSELHAAAASLDRLSNNANGLPERVVLGQGSDGVVISMQVAYIGDGSSLSGSSQRHLLLTIPKARYSGDTVSTVAARYGLTAAESRVSYLLASGLNVRSICDELHITENTVRTHLKRAFAKTGTGRQSALIRLFISSKVGLD